MRCRQGMLFPRAQRRLRLSLSQLLGPSAVLASLGLWTHRSCLCPCHRHVVFSLYLSVCLSLSLLLQGPQPTQKQYYLISTNSIGKDLTSKITSWCCWWVWGPGHYSAQYTHSFAGVRVPPKFHRTSRLHNPLEVAQLQSRI